MQRVRVGLTGLALVLLLVAFASVLSGWFGDGKSSPGNAANLPPSHDEPLADLGAVPGAPANEANPAGSTPKP